MEKGTLVEFRLHGERQLAVVQGTEGKKNAIVAVDSGQTHSVHPRQITYIIPGENYQSSDIPQFWQEVEGYLDPDSLEIAWELLLEDDRAVEPSEMADILFSSQDAASVYAAYRLLCDDRLYFKQKGGAFEPRSRDRVEEIKHQLEVASRKERQKAEFEAKLTQALTDPNGVEWSPSDRLRLESLERYALYGEESSDKAKANDLLRDLHLQANPESALTALVKLGIWDIHENLHLRRIQAPAAFSEAVLEASRALLETPPPDEDERRDLTHLHTYTIDDASTREIDDALSLEFLDGDRQRLWIHIADPTRWIAPGSILDLEARRRATSIYLPDRTIPMFPMEFAAGPMSLRQGELSCALSFGIVLDSEGGIAEVDICPSYIKVSYRLTYEDTDEMLQLGVEKELSAIAAAARLRYQWRCDRGAINIGLPEQNLKVENNIPTIDAIEDTPSRQLVSEMMVLAGAAAAQFAEEHSIPVPYRSQPTPELPSEDELNALGNGHVRSFATMRCMKKGEMAIVPARHAGLGLDSYTQVTSPIRRYSDAIAHFQIKAALADRDSPFTTSELKDLVASMSVAAQEATFAERQTNRYWSLEYLRLQGDRPWHSLVLGHLREHENLALAMLDEIAFRIPVRFQRHVDPGEWVHLRVRQVDPRRDIIEFDEVEA
ncbi:ribonuclease catalytic domain-containing protein [Synechococcus sp. PCC 7336]|uniref:ribonuclease catalytic domain-containing protein n=1 Tax=Synechococcus sp. PCC 7336 TaxID=195250 RepID=UPI00037E6F38|nr:ribonuclease R family protein [Synechococcus sp. PCC 7336]